LHDLNKRPGPPFNISLTFPFSSSCYIANLNNKKETMKKGLAILALTLFIGGTSATAIAATIDTPVAIELREEDDKKKAAKTEKKAEATKKSSDCSSSCAGEKKSDCSSKEESKK
jgi:hypothetical protein